MRDPWKPMLYTMLLLITFLVICNYALANEPKSKWLNENPCMIKVVIKETEKCQDSQCLLPKITVIEKEEVLECKDGYDGPSYWELFAQFYYNQNGITTPAYCRQIARPDHPFKTPGMICLNEQGVWEDQ
tara:strand:- start:42 stop:431 length:390 start_codon:yes stop_codon:yes gene_type:complete